MASEMVPEHEAGFTDIVSAEQFGALARNWLEAEKNGDNAAAEAFEDELHARIRFEEIGLVRGHDAATGEPSANETERVQGLLKRMWSNASQRLD